jgi:hypothetical protein
MARVGNLIVIGIHTFKNKTEVKVFIKDILNKYSIEGQSISKSDFEFFIELLKPRADKIGCGIKQIFLKYNKYGGKTFWIERIDGTRTDFSVYKLLDYISNKGMQSKNEIDFRKACRTSIVEDKKKLKYDRGLFGDAHHYEKLFEQLVRDFIQQYDIDVEKLKFLGHCDGEIEISFCDKDLEQLWIEFHRQNGKMEVLPKEEHKSKHSRI